jgi:calcineurin-like phosphoesterase family protein
MPATFFIGDTHFRHETVSLIRGFSDVLIHDIAIVRQWTKQVKPDDLVFVMGDISGGRIEHEVAALATLRSLPGRKRLIAGNHDGVSGIHNRPSPNQDFFNEVFEKISDFGHVNLNGRRILLSHFPYLASGDGPGRGPARYANYRLSDMGNYLIHAHSHHNHPTNGSATGREICVSWDAWHRMVDMGDISQLIKKMEAANVS